MSTLLWALAWESPSQSSRGVARKSPSRRSRGAKGPRPSVSVACAISVATLLLFLASSLQAQGAPPPARPDSTQPRRPARRTLDIRATAPAPEIVTIRPREIPQFSRALLVPALLKPPADTGRKTPSTVVILPGAAPVQRP